MNFSAPVVIEGPAAAVTAADAKAVKVFASGDEDSYVNALLGVAQSQIDGWNGWLGRAIGLQTLEVKFDALLDFDTSCLPLPPYVDTVSNFVADGVRTVRYRAGYGKTFPADAPAQPLPAAIKHAICLMAAELNDTLPAGEGALRRVTVDGIGSEDYSVPADTAAAMRSAAERLLMPYRVLRV